MSLTDYFQRKMRGEWPFYTKTDDMPDWLYEAIHEAHDDEGPNDWRWNVCYDLCERIEEAVGDDAPTDSLLDDSYEWADSMADIYTSDLLAWLTVGRTGDCDETMEEFGGDFKGFTNIIAVTQVRLIERMAAVLIQAVTDNYEAPEEEDEDG